MERLNNVGALATVSSGPFGLFIPGGHGVMFDLAKNPTVANLINEFDEQGKPIAAFSWPCSICPCKAKDGTPFVSGKKVAAFTDSEERAVQLTRTCRFCLRLV